MGRKIFTSYKTDYSFFNIWLGWNLERSTIPQNSQFFSIYILKTMRAYPIFWRNHSPPNTHSGVKEMSSRAIKMCSLPLKSASNATLNGLLLERCTYPYTQPLLLLPITDHTRIFSPDSSMVYTCGWGKNRAKATLYGLHIRNIYTWVSSTQSSMMFSTWIETTFDLFLLVSMVLKKDGSLESTLTWLDVFRVFRCRH